MFRKGAGNVEFIISFVLFVGFITTAIYFFNPVKDVRTVESLNNYVFDSIAQNSTIEMEFYSVKLIEQPDKCKNIVAVDIENSDGKIASVENYTGNELESGQSGDSVYLKKDGEQFVTIKFGEDLERGSLSGVPVDTSLRRDSWSLTRRIMKTTGL